MAPASCHDATFACRLTTDNMQPYYRRHALEWRPHDFLQTWPGLESYMILLAEQRVGFLSLDTHRSCLYLRDLQLSAQFTGRGIGTWAMTQVTSLAQKRGLHAIRLKVFKDNPAQSLYERLGIVVAGDEDHLLPLERCIRPERPAVS
ncbi:GNAT family N-acetyltransferase [Pseudomonas benzenivorans]|uniref:GNAT family N-acetyltransferase n=1 Tax=Pseudomonas benzenivorans TaxID=556533 RepID=A0ABY5H6L9_9PSED|nr:GNAT family N-acetyltransferase [Pseudomonas benzenivorans]UTW07719.1 GNAT family N-acetyltransferase [Pseudomonas benzenivorans]